MGPALAGLTVRVPAFMVQLLRDCCASCKREVFRRVKKRSKPLISLMEPVVGIEPTTYGLRIRRQFLDHAKTPANVRFLEGSMVHRLAGLTRSTVAPCCAEAFDPSRGCNSIGAWMSP